MPNRIGISAWLEKTGSVAQRRASLRQTALSAAIGLCAAGAAAVALMPSSSNAGGIELDSREYKLMLDPAKFAGIEPRQAVERFTTEQLAPAVRKGWNGDAASELAGKGLEVGERRIVRFWDASGCPLYTHGFAWRARVDTDANGATADEVELTLKFRSPDAFLAVGTRLTPGRLARNADSKLEEDLGPVAVKSGPVQALVASPRGARSQFSRSTKQTVKGNEVPTSLAGIARLYPSFEEELQAVAGHVDMSSPLDPSPEYRELVYESSKLDLVKDLKARFALTLWYKGAQNRDNPALAEISFKYQVKNGEVPTEAARRALALFLMLQDLPWAKPAAPTKTTFVACESAGG
jgi:hypothetical protein